MTSSRLKMWTALVAASAALIAAAATITGHLTPGVVWTYCVLSGCAQPEPTRPEAKLLTVPDVDGTHGDGSKSGTMKNIRVSIIDSPPGEVDKFVATWQWTGRGGSQGGSQNVSIDMMSKDGASIFTVSEPIDRRHCYREGGGNTQTKMGSIDGEAGLIQRIAVNISEVEGRQGPC